MRNARDGPGRGEACTGFRSRERERRVQWSVVGGEERLVGKI